jgi:type I restriction enzyme S subunit
MSDLAPIGWRVDVLTEFADINPKLNQTAVLSDNLKVSFIKMEDVSNNAVVIKKRTRNYSEVAKGFTKFNNNDVLVAKITPCFENGKGGYVDGLDNGVGFGSTEFHVMRAKSNFDSLYLYQYTNFPSFRLQAEASMCGTGGQRRVQTDFLRTHKILAPPLPEQQKIAAILSSVDEVIEKTQAQIDKLKDLKTGMMQELMTRGIGHTEFKDSPVGRIPVGWEAYSLSDLMTLNYGKSPKEIINEDGKNPIWGTGGISNFTNSFLYEGDSILLGRKGTIDKPTFINGKFWVIDTAYYSSNHGENIVQFLSYKLIMINLKALNEASGVPSLSRDTLYSIRMALPPPDEQKKIVLVIESFNTKISIVKTKLSSLQNAKKALMQDLLTGKVRVNPEQTNTECEVG